MSYTYTFNGRTYDIIGKNLRQAQLNSLIEAFFRSYPELGGNIKYSFNYMESPKYKTLGAKLKNRAIKNFNDGNNNTINLYHNDPCIKTILFIVLQ